MIVSSPPCLSPELSNILVTCMLYVRVARSADYVELFAGVFALQRWTWKTSVILV